MWKSGILKKLHSLMPTQNQTGGLRQTNFRDTSRSPDLMAQCLLIGSYLIYPILAYFRNLLLDMKITTDDSRGW